MDKLDLMNGSYANYHNEGGICCLKDEEVHCSLPLLLVLSKKLKSTPIDLLTISREQGDFNFFTFIRGFHIKFNTFKLG